jgi:hypothetical protein
MKKIYLLILIAFLIIFLALSCISSEPQYKSPQGEAFFSAKKTVDIMADLHFVDAIIHTGSFPTRQNGITSDTMLYEFVFQRYGTTREKYLKTLLYHTQNNIDSLDYYYELKIEELSEQQINDTI